MDTIFLEHLEVSCIIGDLPHERCREQQLLLDVEMECDLTAVCKTDKLSDTVNYVAIVDNIRRRLADGRFQMIEAASQCAADCCLEDSSVMSVTVTLRKPGAIAGVCPGVRIRRKR